MSVGVKGLGVKIVYVRGLVASWATQPLNVLVMMIVCLIAVRPVRGSCSNVD